MQERRSNQFYLHVCVRGALLKSFQSMGNIQKPSDTRLQGKQDPFYHLISLRIDEWSSSIFEKSITTIESGFKGGPVFRRAILLFWFKVPTYLSTHIYGFFLDFWHLQLHVLIFYTHTSAIDEKNVWTLHLYCHLFGSCHFLNFFFSYFGHFSCVILFIFQISVLPVLPFKMSK